MRICPQIMTALFLILALFSRAGAAANRALAPSGQPRAVSTTPVALATEVSASLDAITVTFNRPMMDGNWSWTGGGETFPQINGEPSYNEKRTTCTLPVKLEPGTVYWVGINSLTHTNFETTQRAAARRYVILFATRDSNGRPTPLPDDLLKQAKRINTASAAANRAQVPRGQPRVVSTMPVALATDVSASLDAITVTFDRPMMDGNWSWTGGGETFPKINGEPSYNEKRTTCTLPVKLEPGKVYWIGINSPFHTNFKTTQRAAARRYVILFATGDSEGRPTPLPEELVKQAKSINDD